MTKLKNQIVMCIFDERNTSVKKVAKFLNANPNSIASHIFRLKKEGIVESSGYGRYQLTEKGRELAGKLFAKPDQTVVTEMKTQEKIQEPKEKEIDWAREYISLVNKLVERIGGQNG